MNENQYQVFISYARRDVEFGLQLAKDLKSAGFNAWFDQLDIPAGARWDDEVEKALAESEIFLVILTPEAIESGNVKDEIGYAIDAGKKILPVLLKPGNIPLRLRRFQYVDVATLNYDRGIETLQYILRSLANEIRTPGYPDSSPKDAMAQKAQKPSAAPMEPESLFRRILRRLAGDSTTDAPVPKKKKR